MPWRAAVATYERIAQKISAPVIERMQPGDLDAELAHPDDLLGFVIVER
jgi:hypothetical protein